MQAIVGCNQKHVWAEAVTSNDAKREITRKVDTVWKMLKIKRLEQQNCVLSGPAIYDVPNLGIYHNKQ